METSWICCIDGERYTFDAGDVNLIRSDTGAGDDQFFLKEHAGAIDVNVSVFGGLGNDRIRTGGGRDTIYGSDGNDTLDGAAGNDRIDGGAGADHVLGGLGGDILYGSAGADVFWRGDAARERRDVSLEDLVR